MNFIEIASPGCCSYEGVDPPPLPSCPHCAAVTHFQIPLKFEMVVNMCWYLGLCGNERNPTLLLLYWTLGSSKYSIVYHPVKYLVIIGSVSDCFEFVLSDHSHLED